MMRLTPAWRIAARLACLALLAGVAAAQESPAPPSKDDRYSDWGRESHTVPAATGAGVWDGTWFYVNRDEHVALWIKTEGGAPQVKMRYSSLNSGEGFETDWDGRADYQVRDANATFNLGLKRRDADLIEGHWEWGLKAGSALRLEEGDYRMYRAGDGRFLALVFDSLTKTLRSGGKDETYKIPLSWTFRKASKRLVLWDELPF